MAARLWPRNKDIHFKKWLIALKGSGFNPNLPLQKIKTVFLGLLNIQKRILIVCLLT
jgi:hypothetical protein